MYNYVNYIQLTNYCITVFFLNCNTLKSVIFITEMRIAIDNNENY